MASGFQFEHRVPFQADGAEETLRSVPATPGVFALRGERAGDQPYLTRAADLRRRMTRLLAPPESQSKRLNLREKVCWIEYSVTGSEFESLLVLYEALSGQFGVAEARRRMRLHTPYFVRLTADHAHPRVYTTNGLSAGRSGRGLDSLYGPFPSRMAAERYCDAVLDLFKLRRCWEDLQVHPEHPGCAYGEMKKCMAPCNLGCSSEQYGVEVDAVKAFFETHGESLLGTIAADRERASEEMDFERAAAMHAYYAKVKSAAGLADELVRAVPGLRAVVVQKAAARPGPGQGEEAAVFLLGGGRLAGAERLSTLGVRAVKEQTSVGSSLFAQPLMLQAVPLGEDGVVSSADSPEMRAGGVLARLVESLRGGRSDGGGGRIPGSRAGARTDPESTRAAASGYLEVNATDSLTGGELARIGDHLSLFRRWYYRPEKQRAGEVFLPNADGSWPVRRILRGAARMALGEPGAMAETQRDQVEAAKVRILHAGREGVERAVPVVAGRRRKGRGAVQTLDTVVSAESS